MSLRRAPLLPPAALVLSDGEWMDHSGCHRAESEKQEKHYISVGCDFPSRFHTHFREKAMVSRAASLPSEAPQIPPSQARQSPVDKRRLLRDRAARCQPCQGPPPRAQAEGTNSPLQRWLHHMEKKGFPEGEEETLKMFSRKRWVTFKSTSQAFSCRID